MIGGGLGYNFILAALLTVRRAAIYQIKESFCTIMIFSFTDIDWQVDNVLCGKKCILLQKQLFNAL